MERPFLTDLDPRDPIKGSRDPLGFQPLWSALGRTVVENLTTVTVSLRGFTTVVMGFYYVDRLIEERKLPQEEYTKTFLKFEQLAAYSRVACRLEGRTGRYDEDEIRGITRVLRNLSEGSIRISAQQKHQILSNQRTYGLWGLYTVASRTSGLISKEQIRLLPATAEFVESQYARKLGSESEAILKFLEKDRDFEPKGNDTKLAIGLSQLMGPKLTEAEKQFYMHHLLLSGEPGGIQHKAWESIKRLNDGGAADWQEAFSLGELNDLIKQTRSSGEQDVAERLERIKHLESVIAPSSWLFSFLLSRNGMKLDKIAEEIKRTWGDVLNFVDVDEFRRSVAATQQATTNDEIERLSVLANELKKGNYIDAINTMYEQNLRVMQDRGAAPWISFKRGALEVRLSEEPRDLPSRREVRQLWENSYFLKSLKLIGYQIVKGSSLG